MNCSRKASFLDSVKPRFAVDSHLRELFSTGEGGELEQAPQVDPFLSTSAVGPSSPETIREEATPPGEALVPAPSVGESTGAAPVPLPVCLEDAMREDLTRANEQRHSFFPGTSDSIPLVPLTCDENDATPLSFTATILLP